MVSGVYVNLVLSFWRKRMRQTLGHMSFIFQQGRGSEACRALQGNWGLQEVEGLLGRKE